MNGGRRGLQVLVFVYRRTDARPEFLLLKRVPARHGFWQGVTGRVRPGEPLDAAARREVAEETGLRDLRGFRPAGFRHAFALDPPYRAYHPGCDTVEEHVFSAEVAPESRPVLSPSEHEELRWCAEEEAAALLHWPANREALRVVAREIARTES